jgi:hypothetical protein
MTMQESTPENESGARPEGEVLDIRDVLSSIPFDRADADLLGALLTFRTIGDSTIVSVDPDGSGPATSIQIATLEGITGVTLQQLLNNNLDIGC